MEQIVYNANGGFDLFIIIGLFFAYAAVRKLSPLWDKFFIGTSVDNIHASVNSEKLMAFLVMSGSVVYHETRLLAVVCAMLAYLTACAMTWSKR